MVAVGKLSVFEGFEIGGLELADFTEGSPSILGSIASPAGRSGAFALRMNPAATQEVYRGWAGFGSGGTGSISHGGADFHLYGWAVRFSNLAPGTEYAFAEIRRHFTAPNNGVHFYLETNGDIRLEDLGLTTIHTETAPFSVDTWHYMEMSARNNNSSNFEIWIDGVSVKTGSAANMGNSSGNSAGFQMMGAGSGDGNVDFDDTYLVEHTSALEGNNLGPSEVFAYQVPGGFFSATGLTTNDSAPNIGSPDNSWAHADQTPLDSTEWLGFGLNPSDGALRFIQPSTGDGFGLGPFSGIYDVDDTIQGTMWLGVYQRGSGGGAGNHDMWYGQGAQSPINSFNMDVIANNSDTFRAIVSEDAGPVPLANESFAMGAGTRAAQDIEIREMWAFLLHTPTVITDVFPLLPYKKPENVLLRM